MSLPCPRSTKRTGETHHPRTPGGHRKRADCAGCHNKIDPFGFALENYGPTGIWRDKYENGRPGDVSGVLFNQHRV
ncbi:MAG: hypothetical protein Ct9H300mP1_17770 [Planctomycetaceae bacterium]|nr:MAG: hypothetical protein Ct9H300mP1_17770 [Planctomycetaceae bacterium]